MLIYRAAWICPVASRPVRNGAVAVADGRIVAVGEADAVAEAVGDDAEVRDLGAVAIVPGLVNAHVHLELSWAADQDLPGGDYMTWLRALLDRRPSVDEADAARSAADAAGGMLARGTVAVGDVANETWAMPLVADAGFHGVLFHEIYSRRADDAEEEIGRAVARLGAVANDPAVASASDRLVVALTPHAPHTTSEPLLRALAGRANASDEPLTIHVAESDAETAMLRDGSGPLPELFRERGGWDDTWQPPGVSPVEFLDRLGVLGPRTLAVHCVQLGRQDHSRLQSRGVRVVTCPRSNAFLGVGEAPVPELLREGVPVALGTDSLASAPDLDLFAEMEALRRVHPTLSPAAVLRIATLNGAAALGIDDRLGSLEPGKLAALVAVGLGPDDEDPLGAVVSRPDEVELLDTDGGAA
jgi:5-methylthioadenosine/S-adenosylhomocysteine deaminase